MNPVLLETSELVGLMPQTDPFRFVDEISEVDMSHIVGQYRFKGHEFFYSGHFADMPVTPGVIVLEAIAQCALVLHGIYLLASEVPRHELSMHRALFTGAQIEWCERVFPGDTVITRGQVITWRRRRIRSAVETRNQKGDLVAHGEIAGMGKRI